MTEVYLYRNGDIKIERKGDVEFTSSKFCGCDANGMYDAYRCTQGNEDYFVRRLLCERIQEILEEVNELMNEHDKFDCLLTKVYHGEVE